MAYDLEEQDQLEDLKAWWRQWGNTIAGVVIAVSVGVISVQGWRWWTQQQAMQAAAIYDAVNAAVRANDSAKAKDAMAQLADQFLAAQLFENGDGAGAKAQLAWVIDKSSEDELKQIARLRLAEVLLDEKQYNEALSVLDAKRDQPFSALYADARGDILAAAGRADEARNEYQTALAQLDSQSTYRNFVQLKLDAMPQGAGTPARAGAAPAPGAAATAPAPGAGATAPAPPSGATAPTAATAPPPVAPAQPASTQPAGGAKATGPAPK